MMRHAAVLPVTLGDLSVKRFDSMIRDMNNIPKTPILKIIENEPLLRLMGKEITVIQIPGGIVAKVITIYR